jgi:hypothetical protein
VGRYGVQELRDVRPDGGGADEHVPRLVDDRAGPAPVPVGVQGSAGDGTEVVLDGAHPQPGGDHRPHGAAG